MKKQEIKEALNEIINYSEKCRVEKHTDYYQGWRDCLDYVTKELNYLNDKIKTSNYDKANNVQQGNKTKRAAMESTRLGGSRLATALDKPPVDSSNAEKETKK